MSGLFAMVNILADTSGPGTLGLYDGDDPYFAVISGKKYYWNISSRYKYAVLEIVIVFYRKLSKLYYVICYNSVSKLF